jgi:hypothetical protein
MKNDETNDEMTLYSFFLPDAAAADGGWFESIHLCV